MKKTEREQVTISEIREDISTDPTDIKRREYYNFIPANCIVDIK